MVDKKKYRRKIIGYCYRAILKKILFQFDPEKVHDTTINLGIFLGKYNITRSVTRWLFSFRDSMLEQTIFGLRFVNPVGLAAGFDKNGQLMDIMPDVGFGFVEVGSVTAEPCSGNPKPRLWRLPRLRSLAVYYGLKNDGAMVLTKRLRSVQRRIPCGISVAKTNSVDTVETEVGILDYMKGFRMVAPAADYITLNISCPNTFGGEPFVDPERLEKLLIAFDRTGIHIPCFLKLPADITDAEIAAIVTVANRHTISGFVCVNLTKDRMNPILHHENIPPHGGLSGSIVAARADAVLAKVYALTGGKKIIIGVGGIFSAADAYRKIKLGASLVQLITGMIYEGPQLIGEINVGLSRLLKADGFMNITQAVGKGVRI